MELKELQRLSKCADVKALADPVVYSGCLPVSSMLEVLLDEAGIEHRRGSGTVTTMRGEEVGHTWIEVGDTILEPNPSQILGIPRGVMAMDKETWREMVNAREVSSPQVLQPTPAGMAFYQREARDIWYCFSRKT